MEKTNFVLCDNSLEKGKAVLHQIENIQSEWHKKYLIR